MLLFQTQIQKLLFKVGLFTHLLNVTLMTSCSVPKYHSRRSNFSLLQIFFFIYNLLTLLQNKSALAVPASLLLTADKTAAGPAALAKQSAARS